MPGPMPTAPPAPVWSLDGRTAVHQAAAGRCRIDLDDPAAGLLVEPATVPGPADARGLSDAIATPVGPSDGDRLLGVDVGRVDRAVDHWLRAGDLAAVYEPDDSRRLRATAMWRLQPRESAAPGVACELILSAQTSVLESDSGLAVVTEFAAGRVFHGQGDQTSGAGAATTAAGAGVVWRAVDDAAETVPAGVTAVLVHRESPSGPGSIGIVAVHPADLRTIAIERRGDRLRITCWLFTGDLEQTLEKGVLLRGRVLAAVEGLPRQPHDPPTAVRPGRPASGDGAGDLLGWATAAVRRFNASPPPLTT
jgi:hypothetical protein